MASSPVWPFYFVSLVKLPCDKCKKQFNNGRFLLLHKRHVHLGVKKELACPHKCGKSFTRQFHLESHVLLEHEGVRAFGCAFPGCGKRFAMKVQTTLRWWRYRLPSAGGGTDYPPLVEVLTTLRWWRY